MSQRMCRAVRDSKRLLGTAAALLLVACTHGRASIAARADPAATPSSAGVVAFVGANVVPMDRERVLEGHTVVVRDGRIVDVGPDAEARIPEGARRIESRGKYLMPGLAEMHGHVPGTDRAQYLEDVLFLYVSNGVTTVRNMAGHAGHPALRERLANGELLGPTLFTASPWLGGEDVATPEGAERRVRRYRQAGYDLLKIGDMPPPAYARMAEVAHQLRLPFGGHVPESVGLVGALDAKQQSIDHFDRYVEFLAERAPAVSEREAGFFGSGVVDLADRKRIDAAVQRTLDAGTWNVPTLSLVEHLASDEPGEAMARWPEMRYLPAEVVDGWVRSKREFNARPDFQPEAAKELVELRRELLRRLHVAGAPIVLGSDAPQFFNVPGFSIHHELRMMVAAGLTPYEVLATGTRNAAEYFDTPDAFGTVAPGRRADLILLEANPLEDIGNVRRRAGVMVAGRWLQETDIQQRLSEIERRARVSDAVVD